VPQELRRLAKRQMQREHPANNAEAPMRIVSDPPRIRQTS